MVFQGNGVFADWAGVMRQSQGNNQAAAAIEFELNAALNRGIANLASSMWTSGYYPSNTQPRNLYAQFVRPATGATQVFINGLAYGFATDEGSGGGPSKINFNDSSTPSFTITFGSWISGGQFGAAAPPDATPNNALVVKALLSDAAPEVHAVSRTRLLAIQGAGDQDGLVSLHAGGEPLAGRDTATSGSGFFGISPSGMGEDLDDRIGRFLRAHIHQGDALGTALKPIAGHCLAHPRRHRNGQEHRRHPGRSFKALSAA